MRLYAAIWQKSNIPQSAEDGIRFLGTFDVTDTLSFDTQLHGGFSSCSFTVNLPSDSKFYWYRMYLAGHVVLFDDRGNRLYEGIVTKSDVAEGGVSVTSAGYYSRASKYFFDMIYVDLGTTVYNIVHDCIAFLDDWSHLYAHVASANYVVGAQDFTDKKVNEALESVLARGYREDDIRPIYFALWDFRKPYLFPEPAATNYPDWHVSMSSVVGGKAGFSLSLDDVVNRVYAIYDDQSQGPSKTLPAEDYLSQQRYGISEGVVQNGSNPEGLAMANDLRDMALDRYKYPRQVFTMEVSGFIRHGSGFWDYPYRIRAGQQILITDMDAVVAQIGTVSGQAAHGISGFVLKTSYSASSNSTSISFGASDQSLDILMSRLGLSGGLK